MKFVFALLLLVGCSGAVDENPTYLGSPFEQNDHSNPAGDVSCTTAKAGVDCSPDKSVIRCTGEIDRPDTQHCKGPLDRPDQASGRVWCCAAVEPSK
jgi:hypothetical protein